MEIIKQFGFAPIFPTLGFDHGRFSDGGKALRKHYLSNIHTSNMDASKSKEYLNCVAHYSCGDSRFSYNCTELKLH